ncbi:hypothetical protein Dda_1906 [Drechslerella dactyloides]|uniref:Uncharacterized protein n=1 Tax=Drechslerella dactyloides TaxID=74499 RepID=A0AAD6J2S0_DREDA|nr:hypothetical protein Dda_1906 [Drechslerella dactyloides]
MYEVLKVEDISSSSDPSDENEEEVDWRKENMFKRHQTRRERNREDESAKQRRRAARISPRKSLTRIF